VLRDPSASREREVLRAVAVEVGDGRPRTLEPEARIEGCRVDRGPLTEDADPPRLDAPGFGPAREDDDVRRPVTVEVSSRERARAGRQPRKRTCRHRLPNAAR